MRTSDLQKVAHWAKSNHAPSEVYNAACRLLETMPPGPGYCLACGRGDCAPSAEDWREQQHRAETAEAERDALAIALERVRADAVEQQKIGTTADRWKLGVYAQASRTRRIVNDSLDAFEKGAESHGDGRNPQTQGASEAGEVNGAQEASQ